MSNKLYVGGLPFSVTDQELSNLFNEHGTVESANVVRDKYTDKSRGFGFVEMGSQQEAESAIQALNGTDLQGRALTVNMAKPKTDRERGNRRNNNDRY